MESVTPDLKALRDEMAGYADDASAADADALIERLSGIAGDIETLSGAPIADSPAYRAAALIDGTPGGYRKAAEALTIGLSAAN